MTTNDKKWNMEPNIALAKQLAVRDLPTLVCDAVNLEGIAMTIPEVQTLLDGITVGGHKISDQNIALNQAKAWKYIFGLIEGRRFSFNKKTILNIHAIASKDEALESGLFRTGFFSISGTNYEPPAHFELDNKWQDVENLVYSKRDVYDQAITAFLQMARNHFFLDVNKRTSRFAMNGILLSNGFPVINVPATRQQEFNESMLEFYESNNMASMNTFLRSCLNENILLNFKVP